MIVGRIRLIGWLTDGLVHRIAVVARLIGIVATRTRQVTRLVDSHRYRLEDTRRYCSASSPQQQRMRSVCSASLEDARRSIGSGTTTRSGEGEWLTSHDLRQYIKCRHHQLSQQEDYATGDNIAHLHMFPKLEFQEDSSSAYIFGQGELNELHELAHLSP